MGLKVWAYLAASAGIMISLYLFRKKQYKYGYLIVCCSLAVFVGGSLSIGKISGIENSFNAIEGKLKQAQKRVDDLDIKLTQAITLKQDITQTVNLVTEVQKEIANIKEAIHQQYAAFKIEVFKKDDLGKRVAVYPNPLNPEKNSIVFFELKMKPEKNSLQIAYKDGTYAPPNSYIITSNAIRLKRGLVSDKILKSNEEVYVVKYIPDTISDDKMVTIKDVQIIAGEGNKLNFKYQNK